MKINLTPITLVGLLTIACQSNAQTFVGYHVPTPGQQIKAFTVKNGAFSPFSIGDATYATGIIGNWTFGYCLNTKRKPFSFVRYSNGAWDEMWFEENGKRVEVYILTATDPMIGGNFIRQDGTVWGCTWNAYTGVGDVWYVNDSRGNHLRTYVCAVGPLVGGRFTDSAGTTHGWICGSSGKNWRMIDYPGTNNGSVIGFLPSGDFVGAAIDSKNNPFGFKNIKGAYSKLGILPGSIYTIPTSVTKSGYITGYAALSTSPYRFCGAYIKPGSTTWQRYDAPGASQATILQGGL
jgi:hypothetical protein